jgi:hypothetical protein
MARILSPFSDAWQALSLKGFAWGWLTFRESGHPDVIARQTLVVLML